MTPAQFQQEVSRGKLAPVYLFIGPEAYQRDQCRRALRQAALGDNEEGWTPLDLDELSLAEVLDDARAMSLFASERLIWVTGAESALPKRLTEDAGAEAAAELVSYLKNPTPGVVVVFDARRFTYDNEDKTKLERVAKFYKPIAHQVEFAPMEAGAVRALAQDMAKRVGLRIDPTELNLLIEACAGDVLRISNEVEKLSVFAGKDRKVTAEDLAALVANARTSTIFALVAAMGAGNRGKAMDILDALVREGEYLPMALTFVASQFKMALVAHEAGLRNSGQILAHFTKLGVRIWKSRADEIAQTAASFSKAKTEKAVRLLFNADCEVRGTHVDDRTTFEMLIIALTA